jgi:hypothetical protein
MKLAFHEASNPLHFIWTGMRTAELMTKYTSHIVDAIAVICFRRGEKQCDFPLTLDPELKKMWYWSWVET